ncbi:hypothetical protein A2U01_0055263, partial [Trifolium medium]|nr:hypothetical protein [Trifolium medium]
ATAVWRRDGVETSAEAGRGGDGNGGELLTTDRKLKLA